MRKLSRTPGCGCSWGVRTRVRKQSPIWRWSRASATSLANISSEFLSAYHCLIGQIYSWVSRLFAKIKNPPSEHRPSAACLFLIKLLIASFICQQPAFVVVCGAFRFPQNSGPLFSSFSIRLEIPKQLTTVNSRAYPFILSLSFCISPRAATANGRTSLNCSEIRQPPNNWLNDWSRRPSRLSKFPKLSSNPGFDED